MANNRRQRPWPPPQDHGDFGGFPQRRWPASAGAIRCRCLDRSHDAPRVGKKPAPSVRTISAAGRKGICAYLMAPVCRMMKRMSVTRKAALACRLLSRQVQRLRFLLGSAFLGEGGHKMCMRASAYGTSGIFSISISYMLDV